MKHCMIWASVLIVSLVLQSTALPLMAVHGVHPDLLLIVTISVSVLKGQKYGATVGFFAGLLQDLSSGTFFGIHTFSKLLLGYIFGMAERQVFKEHMFLPMLATAAATFGDTLFSLLLLLLLGYHVGTWQNLVFSTGILLAYHMLLAYPVHKFLYRLDSFDRE